MSVKKRRLPERVSDIREAIGNIVSDIGDLDKEGFLLDGKTQRAVVEGLIVIGEAARGLMHLDADIEIRSPDLWRTLRDAYDMRIVLTHEYFRVDAAVVWDTVRTDLPRLDAMLDLLASV